MDTSLNQQIAMKLAQAADLMREHSPRVLDARAAYAVAKAVADVKTPLPNPSISLFPTFSEFADILARDTNGVEAALGWAVLLGGQPRLTDDLNAIRADGALVELGAVEREEYLALRREVLRLAAATRIVEARRDLESGVTRSLDIMKKLVAMAVERSPLRAISPRPAGGCSWRGGQRGRRRLPARSARRSRVCR